MWGNERFCAAADSQAQGEKRLGTQGLSCGAAVRARRLQRATQWNDMQWESNSNTRAFRKWLSAVAVTITSAAADETLATASEVLRLKRQSAMQFAWMASPDCTAATARMNCCCCCTPRVSRPPPLVRLKNESRVVVNYNAKIVFCSLRTFTAEIVFCSGLLRIWVYVGGGEDIEAIRVWASISAFEKHFVQNGT